MKAPSVVRILLFGAGMLLVGHAACRVLGLRETTGLLSRIDLQAAPHAGEVIGFLLYLGTYAGAVLVAPVLLLAAGMIWLYDRMRASRHSEDEPPGATTP